MTAGPMSQLPPMHLNHCSAEARFPGPHNTASVDAVQLAATVGSSPKDFGPLEPLLAQLSQGLM